MVIDFTPEPSALSVEVNWTVTSLLFQPEVFGEGEAEAIVTGGTVSLGPSGTVTGTKQIAPELLTWMYALPAPVHLTIP
jgi:hypothetical protein